jgi:hypothetical protein
MAPCNAETKLEKARTLIYQQQVDHLMHTDTQKKTDNWREMMLSLTPRTNSNGCGFSADIKCCGKYHRQEELQDQRIKAAHFRNEPPDGIAAV